MKKISFDSVKQIIDARIAENVLDVQSHDAVFNILQTVEGKPVDKRTFGKKIESLGFILKWEHGMANITNKATGKNHLIAYSNNPFVDSSKFKEHFDTCHNQGAKKRIEELKAINLIELTATLEKMENAFIALCEAATELSHGKNSSPADYYLYRLIYDREKCGYSWGDFNLSDFSYISRSYVTME